MSGSIFSNVPELYHCTLTPTQEAAFEEGKAARQAVSEHFSYRQHGICDEYIDTS